MLLTAVPTISTRTLTAYGSEPGTQRSCTNVSAHPSRRQTRLTTICNVPPPYIADAPTPQPAPKCTQQLLTQYATVCAGVAGSTTTDLSPTPAPAALCGIPHPTSAPHTRRNRRTSAAATASDRTLQRITAFFPQRVLPPHVATNPANSTPDHDPDKQ